MEAEAQAQHTWKLHNGEPRSLAGEHSRSFISALRDRGGRYGLIPLLGAGLSATSGIPIVRELALYLQRCIGLALGVDVLDADELKDNRRRWNPRKDVWPPLSDPRRPQDIDWFIKVYAEWEMRKRPKVWDPELSVFQEALGALAEWRTSLLFLSRLDHDRAPGMTQQEVLFLNAPSQGVVDKFFRHVIAGRKPTLAHRMLAHLCNELHFKTILTTNFDELLEQAFADTGVPLKEYPVQLGGTLPALADLQMPPCLIKMHGSKYSLRGDYTLDAPPSEEDTNNFISYLVGRQNTDGIDKAFQNHLFVAGFSADDRRIRHLIQNAWKQLDQNFKVFWLCYRPEDVLQVQKFSDEALGPLKSNRKIVPGNEQCQILRHTDYGLLFLEMYQVLTHALPPSGIIFPSVSRLSIPPSPIAAMSTPFPKEAVDTKRAIRSRVDALQHRLFGGDRLVVASATLPNATRWSLEEHGLTSIAAEVFNDLQSEGQTCVWLDLNDISSTDDLFEQLLDTMCYRAGVEDWMPVRLERDSLSRAKEIRRITEPTGRNWVLFLNARETPGLNFSEKEEDSEPNGWLDRPRVKTSEDDDDTDSLDRGASTPSFVDLLHELCGPQCPNLTVVLLCRPSELGVYKELEVRGSTFKSGFAKDTWIIHKSTKPGADIKTHVEEAIKWSQQGRAEKHFLLTIMMMQRTRYASTFWNDAFISSFGKHDLSEAKLQQWLKELEAFGVLRCKSGGFVWLHTLTRQMVRIYFDSCTNSKEGAAIHTNLATWYQQVFTRSQGPMAVFEAAYHSCEAARFHLKPPFAEDNLIKARQSVEWADAQLNTAESQIRTRGFSRGSCRRLKFLGEKYRSLLEPAEVQIAQTPEGSPERIAYERFQQSIENILKRCVVIMRGVAHDVGEQATAYARHRQLCELMVCGEIKISKSHNNVSILKMEIGPIEKRGLLKPMPIIKAMEYLAHNPLHTQPEAPILWIEWWRWLGKLGKVSRSYCRAEKSLRCVLEWIGGASVAAMPRLISENIDPQRAGPISGKMYSEFNAGLQTILGELTTESSIVQGITYHSTNRLRLEIASVLQEYVELILLYDNVERRQGRQEIALWKAARTCYEVAMKLLDYPQMRTWNDSSTTGNDLVWQRLQLRMVASVVFHGNKGSETAALQLLNYAEADLRTVDPQKRSVSWAILSLHRAEFAIMRASEGKPDSVKPDEKETFDAYCRRQQKIADQPDVLKREDINGVLGPEHWGTVLTSLKEAAFYLDQAKEVLLNMRKNVWWATWYFQRRLQTISMELWANLGDDLKAPIPYLGLEAAPRRTPTLADELLDNAIRMVRLDVYRLATVVDAYSSCVLALHIRLLLDSQTERMPLRQNYMRTHLLDASNSLEKIKEMRKASAGPKHRVHASVEAYVDNVQAITLRILGKTEHVNH